MGHSPLHAAVVGLLTELTMKINGPERHLQIQSPITIPPWLSAAIPIGSHK